MASKFAGIVNKLPKFAGEEPDYQEKVNAVKNAILEDPNFERHASTLVTLYRQSRLGDETALPMGDEEKDDLINRLGKEGLEDLLYLINIRMTALEQLLVEQYEIEGVSSLKMEAGGALRVQLEPYAQVQDKESFRRWCIEEGLENLMSIPWQTANSLTKQRLLEGQPEPPGVKAFVKSKIVMTR